MKSMIKFTVPIEPVPFKRPNAHGKQRFNPDRYSAFKDAVALFAKQAMQGAAPFAGEVRIHADFFKPKPRRSKLVSFQGDGDNFLKAVMDALIGICYLDDRQVTIGSFRKIFGNPHIDIELEEL